MSDIDIRLYPNQLQIETASTKDYIDINPVQKSFIFSVINEIANLRFQLQGKLRLSDDELVRVWYKLDEIAIKVVRELFGNQWSRLEEIVSQQPEADVYVVEYPQIWIPWELLRFKFTGHSSLELLGSKRNIFRISKESGLRFELDQTPTINMYADNRLPNAKDEDDYLKRLKSANKIQYQKWTPQSGSQRLRQILSESDDADIIHISGLVASFEHFDEYLVVINDPRGTTREDLEETTFNYSPLVILNTRDNYFIRDPLHILEYVNLLMRAGAIGVITSQFSIPPELAAEFTKKFYNCLLEEKKTIAQSLKDTKQYLLTEFNNPFAIFYAPYFSSKGALILQDSQEESEKPTSSKGNGVVAEENINKFRLLEILEQHILVEEIEKLVFALSQEFDHADFKRSWNSSGVTQTQQLIKIIRIVQSFGPGSIEKLCVVVKSIRPGDRQLHNEIDGLFTSHRSDT